MTAVIELFKWVIQSSIMASILVIMIILLNLVFSNRLEIRWGYFIWLLVVARLLLPFSLESGISIYNLTPVFEQNAPVVWELPVSYPQESPNIDDSGTIMNPAIEKDPPSETIRTSGEAIKNKLIGKTYIILLIWLCGIIAFGLHALIVNIRFWRIVRKDGSMLNLRAARIFEESRLRMNIHTHIPLVESNHIKSPALFGFIRPRLLMPKDMLESMNDKDLQCIMLHELAHLKQKDIVIGWITMILQIIHWFNPFIWYAFYRIRQERELSCDTLALSYLGGEDGINYGKTLIKLVEYCMTPARLTGMASITEGKSQLKKRILAIKTKNTSWGKISTAVCSFSVLIAVALTNPLSVSGSDKTVSPGIIEAAGDPRSTKSGADAGGIPGETANYGTAADPLNNNGSLSDGQAIEFADPKLAQIITGILNKQYSEITQGDLDKFSDLTIVGPSSATIGVDVTGFSADAYYDSNNVQHTEKGNIENLSDIRKFRNLTHLEIDWQENPDASTLDLPGKVASLRLRHDGLSDISFLSDFPMLSQMFLDYNAIRKIDVLSNMKALSMLSVCDNQIEDISPLAGLTNIIWLDISENPISDISPLSSLNNLNSLFACNIADFQLTAVKDLTNLTELNISGNYLKSLDGIDSLKNLQMLMIAGNRLSDLNKLESLIHLRYLDISNNPVTDISVLFKLPALKRVSLYGNTGIDNSVIEKLEDKGIEVMR